MNGKVRIREIADEVGKSNREILEIAKEMGFDVKVANSTVSEQEAVKLVDFVMSGGDIKSLRKSNEDKGINSSKRDKDRERESRSFSKRGRVKKSDNRNRNTNTADKGSTGEKESKDKDRKDKSRDENSSSRRVKKRKGISTISKTSAEDKIRTVTSTSKSKKPVLRKKIEIIKRAKDSEKVEKVERRGQDKEERRGSISVVKVEEKTTSSRKSSTQNQQNRTKTSTSNTNIATATATPVKKRKKKFPTESKKSGGEKLEILGDRDLGDSIELYEEQEVILLDFADRNIYEEQQRQQDQKKKEEIRRKGENNDLLQKRGNSQARQSSRKSIKNKKKKQAKKIEEAKKVDVVKIPEDVRVHEFAEKINKSVGEVVKVLFSLGTMVTQNDFLDKDSIEILADEFNVKVETINPLDALDYVSAYDEEPNRVEEPRAPIITVMGHVDHGKTSLLDKIRSTKVAVKEAGGITQHVGAYQVEKDGQKITFIDTPGHSAFTEMRARGAQATDIAIIVVAADDGVMPQTKESISHAKAANVPIIIAINKIDKPTANPDNVKSQLAEIGIMPVDWGGEYEFVNVSAHTGEGIDELLETILIQAEIMELKADPTRRAKAIVIESSLERGFGAVADVIIKNGSLNVGDNIIVGTTFGRVRTLILADGSRVKKIGPSTPAAVVGLSDVPEAGEVLIAMESEKEVREIAQKRKEYARVKELSKSTKASIEELNTLIAEGKIKKLPLIIKADVQGSLEAIKSALDKLKNEEVKVEIIHSGVGSISEGDVILADTSKNALILGFNVRPIGNVKKRAEELGIEIKTYSIIYDLIDEVKALLGGLMSPVFREEITGQAEVRETFVVAKVGTIAGCKVVDGKVMRNSKARLIRDGIIIYNSSKIASLKRFSEDVKEVRAGFECGIMLENFNDIKIGDIIETFEEVEEQVSL